MSNLTNKGGSRQASTYKKAGWWLRNYRTIILLSVTIIGLIAMAVYKISVAAHNLPFILLASFAELAAGVAVFAQALLRQVDKTIADRAFKFSIYARLAMCLIGVALFVESTNSWSLAYPYFKLGAMSWAAFLTYELCNGLMLLIEYMFSHLLQVVDKDQGARVAELEELLEKNGKTLQEKETALEELSNLSSADTQELEGIRSLLAPFSSALGSNGQTLPAQLELVLSGMEEARKESDLNQAKLEESGEVLVVIKKALEGTPVKHGAYHEHHLVSTEGVQELIKKALEASALRVVVEGMAGQSFTVRKNVSAFYCKKCYTYNEHGRGRSRNCGGCGTNQDE